MKTVKYAWLMIAMSVPLALFAAGEVEEIGAHIRSDLADLDFQTQHKKASGGDAGSQVILGFKYLLGQEVPQDYAEAVKWFRKAAEQGDERSQTILGLAFRDGRGVPQNYAEAVKYFGDAARQGNEFSQLELGTDTTRAKE